MTDTVQGLLDPLVGLLLGIGLDVHLYDAPDVGVAHHDPAVLAEHLDPVYEVHLLTGMGVLEPVELVLDPVLGEGLGTP